MTGPRTPFAPSARSDRALLARLERLARDRIVVRFGSIDGTLAATVFGTITGPGSYTTGGFDVTPLAAGTVLDVILPPKVISGALITFEYDSGTGKLLAYDTGVEVVAATDLSSSGPMYYTAIVQQDAERFLFTCLDDRLLESVYVLASETVSADSSNYWTIGLQRVGDRNVQIASLSTDSLTLTAKERTALFEPDGGLSLNQGDSLRLKFATTGTPNALVDLAAELQFRRRVA